MKCLWLGMKMSHEDTLGFVSLKMRPACETPIVTMHCKKQSKEATTNSKLILESSKSKTVL